MKSKLIKKASSQLSLVAPKSDEGGTPQLSTICSRHLPPQYIFKTIPIRPHQRGGGAVNAGADAHAAQIPIECLVQPAVILAQHIDAAAIRAARRTGQRRRGRR